MGVGVGDVAVVPMEAAAGAPRLLCLLFAAHYLPSLVLRSEVLAVRLLALLLSDAFLSDAPPPWPPSLPPPPPLDEPPLALASTADAPRPLPLPPFSCCVLRHALALVGAAADAADAPSTVSGRHASLVLRALLQRSLLARNRLAHSGF